MGFNFTYSLNCGPLKVPSLVTLSSKSTSYGAEVRNLIIFFCKNLYLNSQITVACPPGYEFLNGAGRSFETRCQLGGKWSRQDISTCQPIYCSPVPQIPNGYAFYATNVSFGGSFVRTSKILNLGQRDFVITQDTGRAIRINPCKFYFINLLFFNF